jgi:hypothetical protein
MTLTERLNTIAHDRRVLGVIVGIGLAICARQLAWSPLFHLDRQLVDYRVFWCAGQAALDGADPYLTEPLRTCEQRYGTPAVTASPNLVMPFVLPPYDVPAFALLARLPLTVSGLLFTVLGVVALIAGIVLVARSVRVPLALSAAALSMSVGLPSLVLGQIVPFELAALAATAFAVSRRRDALAGACAVLTLFAPHVGAFVVLTMLVLLPRARLALGIGIAALGLVTVFAGGPARTSYLAALAQQAAAEARSNEQYSLTFALTFFHTPAGVALALGTVSTCVMLVAAVLLSRAAYRAGATSAVVYLPAACAVLGGTFVHITQIALAVPAALLFHEHAPDRTSRALGSSAVLLLAVPWPDAVLVKAALAPALVVLGVTTWYAFGGELRRTAAVVVACWLLLIPIENRPPPAVPVAVLERSPGTVLASVSWMQAVRQRTSFAPRDLLVKLPTWAGLLAVVGSAFLSARRTAFSGRMGDDAR